MSDPTAAEHLPHEPEPRRRAPAGHALGAVIVALLLGSLLNADRLDHTARTQPFGWQRTWATRVTGPLKAVSHATGLHLPRRFLAELAGNEDPPPPEDTRTVVTVPPTTAPTGPATGTAPASSTTTTTTTVPARTPTAEEPLRVLVVGDSLMGWMGPALSSSLEGRPVAITEDWEVGSGLARPDVVNWPVRLAEDLERHDPEVVVIGFGGNDAQDMVGPEGRVTVGSPEWRAEYQRRVAQVLTAVEARGRSVYWIGLPLTTRGSIEEAAPAMADAARTEISARPWAHYVDSRSILSPDGAYTAYLPDGSGGEVKVREDDGVHPNLAGARRLVAPVVEALRTERRLG